MFDDVSLQEWDPFALTCSSKSQTRANTLQRIEIGTDGVWEMQNEEGVLYGKERLYEFIRENAHLPASEISSRLYEVLDRFRGSGGQDDDVTFVIIKVQ